MLNALGYSDLQEFIADVVPADILDSKPPVEALPEGCREAEALQQLKQLSETNTLRRSLIGEGYPRTATPARLCLIAEDSFRCSLSSKCFSSRPGLYSRFFARSVAYTHNTPHGHVDWVV